MNPTATVKLSRRDLLRRVITSGGLTTAGGLYAFSAFWQPNHPVIENVTLTLSNWPAAFDKLRVAFLSDLHVQPGFGAERLTPALALVREARPDLILLGGDYCNEMIGGREEWMERCADALKGLTAPMGVFAIFGNHDFPLPPFDPPRRPWVEAGIVPLLDEAIALERGGDRVFVVGLRSAIARPYRGTNVAARLPIGASKIMMLHEPAYIPENSRAGGSLMLSGHTHGGQVVVPGIGPLVLPHLSNGYHSGLYGHDAPEMPLYVTRGVGLLPPMVRFDCPPEVTLFTLRCGDGKTSPASM